jgi:CheY-like chemotaxis protein
MMARMTTNSEVHFLPDMLELHLLVIDDDPLFRALIKRAANKRNIKVTACSSRHELVAMTDPGLFHVVIVDYYLDEMKTHLRGTDVARELVDTPTLLISNSGACLDEKHSWPDNICKFAYKSEGADRLLDQALQIAAKKHFE